MVSQPLMLVKFLLLGVHFRDSPRASLMAQTVKNLPAMQETWVQPLVLEAQSPSREDLLE